MILGVVLLTGLAGCSEGQFDLDTALDQGVQKLFAPRQTPQQAMVLAVSSEDADLRRDAVTDIAKSKKYDEEWAIKGFVAIATLESDEQTRCVAIRALVRTGDSRAVETCLKIINYRDYPPAEVWPPTDLVRWDATAALADLSAAGMVPEELRGKVRAALLSRLRMDTERHARVAAANGLAFYSHPEVVGALIEGLRDEDFAVVHACENSLVALTGVTHHTDVLAWEAWLADNEGQLFAQAGNIPPSQRPPYNNKWEKFSYETKDLIRWLWPGEKEE